MIFQIFNSKKSSGAALKYALLGIAWFFSLSVFSQTGPAREIGDALDLWNGKLLKENVFVHTDRETYLTGEILWFKGYVMEGNHHLSDLSKVLYVEVLSADRGAVLQAKLALSEGTGKGSFYLPAQLPSGEYELRAYTSLLKNFGPDSYFRKTLRIYNTQDDSLAAVRVSPKKEISVELFPEGGYLVDGLESRVGCTVFSDERTPLSFRGAVLNGRSDTVFKFASLQAGLGSFLIKPAAGEKYRVVVEPAGGESVMRELPPAQQAGYSMKLMTDDSAVRIQIEDKGEDAGPLHLVVHSRTGVCFTGSLPGGRGVFEVEKRVLKEGLNYFTVFNKEKRPVGERLFFKSPAETGHLILKISGTSMERRQKVSLDVSVLDRAAAPLQSNLSLSVFYLPSNLGARTRDIRSYVYVASELKGQFDGLETLWENANGDQALLDAIMLCSQPKGINWAHILAGATNRDETQHLPEYDGHLVRARVTEAVTGEPVPNVLCYLSVPGNRVQLCSAISNKDGILIFNSRDLYGHNELVLQAAGPGASYKFELLSPFASFVAGTQPSGVSMPSGSVLLSLRQLNINMQVSNAFLSEKLRQIQPAVRDSIPFFGRPDKTYFLDDYTRFATTEEVLREYIPEIWLQRRAGRRQMSVVNQQSRLLFQSEPLMMLDGVPFFLTEKILKYDPLKIKSIDIITNRYFWGPSSFDGIVHFKTYKGNLEGYQLDSGDQVVDYEGLLEQRKFYLPEYSSELLRKSTLPDFRNLLFWEPDVKTRKVDGKCSISFYTSDLKGTFVGSLQGVAADGTLVSKTFSFKVK
ncbi:hypothetical protein [Arcticibacter sp. MXS-1]|uniref:hypothetical protein n=1 Tax=Arcticibacter sp. MXS-1 TaxID=3341726 RepID=UPI0035A96A78